MRLDEVEDLLGATPWFDLQAAVQFSGEPFLVLCVAFAGLIRNLSSHPRFPLALIGHLRQYVHDAMIPAPPLLGSWEDVA